MTHKQIFLACLNKLRASKNIPRTKTLDHKTKNSFLAIIEDADSYAVYGYGFNTFIKQNPCATYYAEEYGSAGTELCRILFSIGYAQCAEDNAYESTKWEELINWASPYIDHSEAFAKTKTLELIDRIPTGEIIPVRILAVLKKAGVIEDYSTWGYLEGDYQLGQIYEYKGRFFTPKYLDGCFNAYLIKANIKPTTRTDYLQFKGNFKRDYTGFLSDKLCSNAWKLKDKLPNLSFTTFHKYLDKKSAACKVPATRTTINCNRRISLYGAVI